MPYQEIDADVASLRTNAEPRAASQDAPPDAPQVNAGVIPTTNYLTRSEDPKASRKERVKLLGGTEAFQSAGSAARCEAYGTVNRLQDSRSGTAQLPPAPDRRQTRGHLQSTMDSVLNATFSRDSMRWLLIFCVTVTIFEGHFTRDSVASVSKQIESDLGLSLFQYNTLTSAYFAPNIFTPILAGFVAHQYGPGRVMLAFLIISTVGHVVFAVGVVQPPSSSALYPLLLCGRLIQGTAYETIDMTSIPLIQPFFKDSWGLSSGLVNGALRLGSVVQFLLLPVMYSASGSVVPPLLLSSFVGMLGLPLGLALFALHSRLTQNMPNKDESGGERSQLELPDEAEAPPVLSAAWELGGIFWLYMLGGMFMYGSMVPFWFMGSKFLQENYNLSVENAGIYLMLPEGTIVVMAPCLGLLLDKLKAGDTAKTLLLMVAVLGVSGSYCLLVFTELNPLFAMISLGFFYSISNTVFWGLVPSMTPHHLLAIGCGLLGSTMALLPSVVPLLVHAIPDFGGLSFEEMELVLLAFLGFLGFLCFMFLAIIHSRSSNLVSKDYSEL